MNNTLPWPSIDQLPLEICAKIKRHLTVADPAAFCIQCAWRRFRNNSFKAGRTLPGRAAFAGGSAELLQTILLRSPVFCSEKIDGTNVGKLRDGTLLGRRMVIHEAASDYQRCPLAPLREMNTDACLDELTKVLAQDGEVVKQCALYGELSCNPGLYDYAARKLNRNWQVFGAVFRFDDLAAALMATKRVPTQGFT